MRPHHTVCSQLPFWSNVASHIHDVYRWNFPAAMVTRKLAPALAAGCTSVLKTAGETPFTANALLILLSRTGIPPGVVNSVTALDNTPAIGRVLCSSDLVRKISFTGSTRVGKLLMSQSSGTLKKLSLELGGNAPFIVFNDADLDLAVAAAVTSKFKSSGQTCVCSNRIFVQKGVHDEFLKRLTEAVAQFCTGSGFDEKTTHGPLISAASVDRLGALVKEATEAGAKVLVGGSPLSDKGEEPHINLFLISRQSTLTLCSRSQLLRSNHHQRRHPLHAPRPRRDLRPHRPNLQLRRRRVHHPNRQQVRRRPRLLHLHTRPKPRD